MAKYLTPKPKRAMTRMAVIIRTYFDRRFSQMMNIWETMNSMLFMSEKYLTIGG